MPFAFLAYPAFPSLRPGQRLFRRPLTDPETPVPPTLAPVVTPALFHDAPTTAANTLLDLMAAWDSGSWRLALNVNNATDRTYVSRPACAGVIAGTVHGATSSPV